MDPTEILSFVLLLTTLTTLLLGVTKQGGK